MNYSDYFKEYEVASKIPDTAAAYSEAQTRMEKAKILAEAFCIPQTAALQWVATSSDKKFDSLLLNVRINITEAERLVRNAIAAESQVVITEPLAGQSSHIESLPVVKDLQVYRTPQLFLRTQAFPVAMERNGYDSFVYFLDNAVQVEMLYAMQMYGWKVDRLELVNRYFGDGSETDFFKEAAFIIRKQKVVCQN